MKSIIATIALACVFSTTFSASTLACAGHCHRQPQQKLVPVAGNDDLVEHRYKWQDKK